MGWFMSCSRGIRNGETTAGWSGKTTLLRLCSDSSSRKLTEIAGHAHFFWSQLHVLSASASNYQHAIISDQRPEKKFVR